jgi:hypothetical protein
LLGLVLFVICIALTASLDQFLLLLRPESGRTRALSPSPGNPGEGRGGGQQGSLAGPHPNSPPEYQGRGSFFERRIRAHGHFAWGIAGAFLVLGIVSQARVGGLWPASSLSDSAQFNMPATLAGWERVEGSEQVIGRPEVLGQHSSIWTYRQGGRSVLVAFDYPFPGYHELATCYLASGWTITTGGSRGKRDTAGPDGLYTRLQMQRPSPAFAYLLYSCCDEQGHWLGADAIPDLHLLKLALALSYQKARAPQAYQVQVLMQGFTPPSEDDKKQTEQLFLAAREQFANQLVEQVEAMR